MTSFSMNNFRIPNCEFSCYNHKMIIRNVGSESGKPLSAEDLEKMRMKKKAHPVSKGKGSSEYQPESEGERESEEGKGKNLDLQA